MCIIAAKPANTPMPSMDTIETMWYANPHGAGIMYPITQKRKGKNKGSVNLVQIEKGFMELKALKERLIELGKSMDLTATPVVMHFRITTHGGTCPANTHPFPVTSSVGMLQKIRTTTTLGVAHNGIIHSVSPRKGISDTMEYVATQLAPLSKALPRWYENEHALRLVENAIDSKLAVLTPEGSIHLVGKFINHEGIMYSNSSYEEPKWASYCSKGYGWSAWDEDELDADTPKPTFRYLCYLTDLDKGAYGRADDGSLFEGEDLAIDSSNRVYWFDPELGYWSEQEGWTAMSGSDTPLRYDYKHAVGEATLTVKQTAVWYDYLYGTDTPPFDEDELPQ